MAKLLTMNSLFFPVGQSHQSSFTAHGFRHLSQSPNHSEECVSKWVCVGTGGLSQSGHPAVMRVRKRVIRDEESHH